MEKQYNLARKEYVAVGAILLLAFMAYGLLIPWIGFYLDDWPLVWAFESKGVHGLMEYFSQDRVFDGVLYALLFPVLKHSTVLWQAAALLSRAVAFVLLWLTLGRIWPSHPREVFTIVALCSLYPGFSLESLAVVFIVQHVSLVLITASFLLMVIALQSHRMAWLYTSLAMGLMFSGVSLIEYYIGLELMRPVVIAALVARDRAPGSGRRALRTLWLWCPYVITLGAYLVWRVLWFHPRRAGLDVAALVVQAHNSPVALILNRLKYAFRDMFLSSVMAWGRTLEISGLEMDSWSIPFAWGVGLVALMVVLIALRYIRPAAEEQAAQSSPAKQKWGWTAIAIGIATMVVCGLPAWTSGLAADFAFFEDRLTMPFAIGVSIALTGLLCVLWEKQRKRNIVVGVLVMLATAFQVRSENRYRQDWDRQKSLAWQLAWRCPDVKPGVAVVFDGLPETLRRSHSIGLSYVVWGGEGSNGIRHFLFDLGRDVGDDPIPRIDENIHLSGNLRQWTFDGNTSNSLLVWYSASSSLRVVDSRRLDDLPQLTPTARAYAVLSKTDGVVEPGRTDHRLLRDIMGPEPKNSWAYFFQKADLARQYNNWRAIAELGDSARNAKRKPEDPEEWLVFIEAYTNVERYQEAIALSKEYAQDSMFDRQPLLNIWKKALDRKGRFDDDVAEKVRSVVGPIS